MRGQDLSLSNAECRGRRRLQSDRITPTPQRTTCHPISHPRSPAHRVTPGVVVVVRSQHRLCVAGENDLVAQNVLRSPQDRLFLGAHAAVESRARETRSEEHAWRATFWASTQHGTRLTSGGPRPRWCWPGRQGQGGASSRAGRSPPRHRMALPSRQTVGMVQVSLCTA